MMPAQFEHDAGPGDLPLSHCLKPMDPALARLRGVAFGGRDTVRFNFGDAPFMLRFMDEESRFTPALALLLRVGTAQGWLLLESYDVVGEEWASVFQRLDPALVRALLIEQVSRQFAQVAEASGEAVQLVDLQVGQTFVTEVPTQALRIENETSGVGVRAALRSDNPEFFKHLAKALATCTPCAMEAPPLSRLPLQIGLGVAWLQQGEIAQTRVGDVFIFPVGGTLAAVDAVCLDGHGRQLPIRARLQDRSGCLMSYEGEMMSNEQNEMKSAQPGEVRLEDVSVPVTAIIGELELPLQAIGTLQAGYVFELPTSVEHATVRLFTGSRCVGTGQLVAVGERLGVRLLQWGGSGHV